MRNGKLSMQWIVQGEDVPDNLRIWVDTPNERIPLARLDYYEDLSARVIRKHIRRNRRQHRLCSFWQYQVQSSVTENIISGRIIIRAESEERSLEPAGPLLAALGKLPFTQCPSDTPLFSIKTYTPLWLREGSALL